MGKKHPLLGGVTVIEDFKSHLYSCMYVLAMYPPLCTGPLHDQDERFGCLQLEFIVAINT